MHIGIEGAEIAVARVECRVAEGGHAVPEDKIRSRYERGGALIRQAVLQADRGLVFDNSALNMPPRQVLGFAAGRLTQADAFLPAWVLGTYGDDLQR